MTGWFRAYRPSSYFRILNGVSIGSDINSVPKAIDLLPNALECRPRVGFSETPFVLFAINLVRVECEIVSSLTKVRIDLSATRASICYISALRPIP
jgi:hypothetical protein